MNIIFTSLIVIGIIVAAINGNIEVITQAAVNSAASAVEKIFGLVGIISLWLGIAKIAEKSGLIEALSRMLYPLVKYLFPSIPEGHPAMGSMLMNMSANLLGFGSAATPFGLKAIAEMQQLNDEPDTATEAMCTFLAINTSSVTLVPATIIGLRASAGAKNPTDIISCILFATTCSTATAITADYIFRTYYRIKKRWGR
ncbi:MAG: spore maturation protein [Thermosediminibacterales bacterium]|nr:spore maturation protein [Thermosediminibacterales bacterium]